MPFSSPSGKAFTTRFLQRVRRFTRLVEDTPRVLDIGAGSGTYADLYRQHPLHGCTWHAVEIWEPYVEKYQLKRKYNKVFIASALDVLNEFQGNPWYGVAFAGDVLEHMTVDQARDTVRLLRSVARVVIVSIPIGHYPQDEYDGNPYEKHVKDDWTHDEVIAAFGEPTLHHLEREIGVYVYVHPHDAPQVLSAVSAPKVAVYMICKDEKDFIRRALASCYEADQLVVLDTGSTDGTWESLTEPLPERRLVARQAWVRPWRFDDARNTAMSLVWPEIDLCISLDADEELAPGFIETLRSRYDPTVTRYNHRFRTIWDWNTAGNSVSEHWHERVHVRQGYRWVLPVHEKLEWYAESPEKVGWLDNAWMEQRPDTTKNRGSYLPLLEASVAERPDVWKSWTFLAGEYANRGELQKAVDATKKALELPDSDKAFCNSQLGSFAERLGDFKTANMGYLLAVAQSNCREYFVWSALYFHRRGDKNVARALIAGAEAFKERTYGYEYNPACWGEQFEQTKRMILA